MDPGTEFSLLTQGQLKAGKVSEGFSVFGFFTMLQMGLYFTGGHGARLEP